jgi:hypothetical protein
MIAPLVFAGCTSAPVETFYAHQRPEKTATIVEADGAACQLINEYVVGVKPAMRPLQSAPATPFIVPAGPVRMVVGYFEYRQSDTRNAPGFSLVVKTPYTGQGKQIDFMAEAGHTYTFVTHYGFFIPVFSTEMRYDEWDVDVIDKETKAVVAATHDRKKPTTEPANVTQDRS